MAKNVLAYNNINMPSGVNLLSVYITKTEKYYHNPFIQIEPKNVSQQFNFMGIFHCIDGEGTIRLADKTLTVKKDELVFLRRVDIRSLDTQNSEWEFYCVWFYSNNTMLDYNTVYSLPVLENEDDTVRSIIKLLNTGEYYKIFTANGICQTLLGDLLDRVNSLKLVDNYYDVFQNVINIINQNIEQTFSISELAKRCFMSEKHFRQLFAKYTGMPPKQYIETKKFDRAAFMLTDSSFSVAYISNALSFSSPAYFIRCFKKYYKMTPTQYRKANRYDK